MASLENKTVLVVGLGASGVAASTLLLQRGAKVVVVDGSDSAGLRQQAALLRGQGAEVSLGATTTPDADFDFAVVSPGVPSTSPIMREVLGRGLPLIGELEFGYQHSLCLNISITGTNGKTTTTELIARMLMQNQLKTIAAGNIGRPICSVVDQTPDLDFLTLEVSSFQLETIQYFRPVIAVLLNLTPDHLDRHANMEEYIRAKARVFMNQQAFDWAIIQSDALAQVKQLGITVPSKIITFSATDSNADIFLDRGMIISRIDGWTGPLLDMDHCLLRGPHNAENLMGALAVGRVLRIPLGAMVDSLKTYAPAAHRCELVAEVNGVQFINDSKATNLDAVHKAVLSVPPASGGQPNIWLIAGGKDKGLQFHDLGPLLTQRVRGAFLIGETRQKLQAAWSLFTPCTIMNSLAEAVAEAARQAAPGDVVLLSPACSSFDQFDNYAHRGEVFRQAVHSLTVSRPASLSGGANTRLDSGPTGSRQVNPLNVGASGRPRACTEAML